MRQFAGVLLEDSRQLLMDLFGSLALKAFVVFSGGYLDKSKSAYVKCLVYVIITRMLSEETGKVSVGSFRYDRCSSKKSAGISGMNYNFVDAKCVDL